MAIPQKKTKAQKTVKKVSQPKKTAKRAVGKQAVKGTAKKVAPDKD